MSHYVVGDIQGCHAEFRQLLDLIGFDAASDRLWLVGDLVNRGPDSLGVLRTVRAMGSAAVTVLGNHDFHLLTVAAGHRRPHRHDTLNAILDAPDREELLAWLRTRPLIVSEADRVMVHAGLLPSWTPSAAVALAREVEAMLASDEHDDFLRQLYGDEPSCWSSSLTGYDRLRVIVNVCTRLRYCSADDVLQLAEKRGPDHTPQGYAPWFAHPQRKSSGVTVFCGHWSTLELLIAPRVVMLDSGCLWGGTLTALRLDDWRLFQVPSRAPLDPAPKG
ncbi:MAG: symmetrical bis(5'-nucleosyl)-tetraphosphatase [Betaproteobacteria bacterium]|nr:MAG: symmetrical bis(5'-nucleosyl)-tetraphosphatase [Betaproteobacteria bacterium]